MARVFIGLPVHNGEAYLHAALDSLLNQTFHDFQVLISDNASSDSTPQIGRSFARRDSRFLFHRHETNLGAAPNFNFCVDRARGSYFKWMAHDDMCRPTYLQRCMEVLERDAGAVLCHSRVQRINGTGAITGPYSKELNFNDPDPAVRFARAMAFDHACVTVFGVMRLETLRQTPAIAPFVGSDRPLLAELALHGRLEYVDEELFLWRDHETRSVKKQRHDRLVWFDAKAKNVLSTLFLRQAIANQKAALAVPDTPRGKARAFAKTAQWLLHNHALLAKDARALAGAALRRLGLLRPPTQHGRH